MEYRKAIVSFVDILGFRSMVETREPDFIASILRRLTRSAEPFMEREGGVEFINFSDNVVRVAFVERAGEHGVIDRLYTEVASLAASQLLLSQRGVFLRGGITIGPIAFGEGMIFGPAMNRAYELESKVAKTPRIILDESIERRSRRMRHVISGEFIDEDDYRKVDVGDYSLARYLRRDHDGRLFIDYIHGMGTEADDEPGDLLRFFENHRRAVVEGAEAAPPDAAEKYAWLRGYHDSSLRILTGAVLEHFGRTRDEFACSGQAHPDGTIDAAAEGPAAGRRPVR